MAQTLAPITALLLSVALVLFGHGLQSTLIPLAAELAHFTDTAIGAMSSAYFIGFVAGCVLSPFMIMRAGHIRTFAALVSLMSGAAILHPILVEASAWSVIRIVSGFCLAGFYLIVESWLNEQATNENRGTIMSIYVVILFTSMTAGQVMLPGLDISSFIPFAIASFVVSVAVVPVAMTRSNQPAPITLVRFRPAALYKNSPAALIGCLMIGMANAALWTLAPLYATKMGFDIGTAAYYAAAILLGGALSQWPIGRLSDKIDRRIVLVGLGFSAAACGSAVLIFAPDTPYLAIGFACLMGVVTQPSYSIAAAHAFDHADADSFVETSSGLLLANGIGSVIGPFAASILIQSAGPSGLYIWVIAVEALMAGFIFSRLLVRAAPIGEEKTDFEYATTAQMGAVITPEPLDTEDRDVIPPEEFPAYEFDANITDLDAEPAQDDDDKQAENNAKDAPQESDGEETKPATKSEDQPLSSDSAPASNKPTS